MKMTFRWLPECASLLNTYKHQWLRHIPLNPEAPVIALEFFSWVASLMSLQLRKLVTDSLKDLLNFICMYKVWLKSLTIRLFPKLWKLCSESGRTCLKIDTIWSWLVPLLFVLYRERVSLWNLSCCWLKWRWRNLTLNSTQVFRTVGRLFTERSWKLSRRLKTFQKYKFSRHYDIYFSLYYIWVRW